MSRLFQTSPQIWLAPGAGEIAGSMGVRQAVRHALAERSVARNILVAAQDDAGNTGWGECCPRPYVTGETIDSVKQDLGSIILPQLLGRELESFGQVRSLIEPLLDSMARNQQAAFCAAELALLPSFALTLEGGRVSDGLLSLLNLNPWALHGAAGLDVPIYTGGRLTAQVKIATAQQEQAIALYGSVALKAFYEVEVALTNETLLEERLRILEREIADRAESVRIARLKYTVGAMDMLSVLQLQEGLLQSRAKLIQLRYALLANRINLHLALGGGFDAAPASVIAN